MKLSQSIPLPKIRLDGGTQPRAALDFNAVEDYAEAMSAGAKFPPATVYYDGELYWLADGFHRVKAARAAGLDAIECAVHQGTLADAQWHSFSANKANGLRRTNADKQRAVEAALAHPRSESMSDSAIARHCGVTTPTVAAWREKLGLSIKILKIGTRTVRRNGKTYQQNTSKIGRPPRVRKPKPLALTDESPNPPAEATNADQVTSVRTTRAQRIDRLARSTLSFIEATKHLVHLVGWLGETAGDFDQAELLLSNAGNFVGTVIAEIERKALAADPLNASRLGIQENLS